MEIVTGIDRYHFRCAYKANTKSEEFLMSSKNVLNSIRYNSKKFTNTLPCLIGWRNYVECLLNMSEHLRKDFLLKLNQLQRASSSTQNSPHFLNMTNILPISVSVSILEENCVVSLSVVICNYIRRNYCESCVNLVCLNVSSNFSNIHLSMDKF